MRRAGGDEQLLVDPEPGLLLIATASVIICTRNRASQLPVALAGLAAQSVDPALHWEIVVVDNGSSDGTEHVLRDWVTRLPAALRWVNEPVPGLSAARNRGWREARGEIAVFLDDDCLPELGWLQALVDSYDAAEIASVTGRLVPSIDPVERERIDPAWQSIYTFDYGDVRRDVRRLSGANMSFRRSALEAIGGFDEDLGRVGACLLAGDDNHAGDSLLRQPEALRIVYQPEALVTHSLRADALSDSLLLKRSYCGGISNAILDARAPASHRLPRRLGRALRMAIWALRALRSRLPGGKGSRLGVVARRQAFIGYRRQRSGGIERACRDCPMLPERERRLALLARPPTSMPSERSVPAHLVQRPRSPE